MSVEYVDLEEKNLSIRTRMDMQMDTRTDIEIIADGIAAGTGLVGVTHHTTTTIGAMHTHRGMAMDTGADHEEVGL